MQALPAGGPEGDRTLDLRVANAALSQLSYEPVFDDFNIIAHERRFVKHFFRKDQHRFPAALDILPKIHYNIRQHRGSAAGVF